jgi:hypothetical protein
MATTSRVAALARTLNLQKHQLQQELQLTVWSGETLLPSKEQVTTDDQHGSACGNTTCNAWWVSYHHCNIVHAPC